MKNCSNKKCKQVNPQSLDSFYRKSGSKHGYTSQCKYCISEFNKTEYNKNPEKKKENARKQRINNPAKKKTQDLAYRLANKEQIAISKASWAKEHPENINAASTRYRLANPEKMKSIRDAWIDANPGYMTAKNAKRRSAKLKRTPLWLTREQLSEIRWFYDMAKDLQWLSDPSDPLTVDHIVPLQGNQVSGLHVPWNLQILPKSLNSRYGNRIK